MSVQGQVQDGALDDEMVEEVNKEMENIHEQLKDLKEGQEAILTKVTEQGEQLNNVETNVDKAAENVRVAVVDIEDARESACTGRKLTVGIVILVLVILLAIGLGVGIPLGTANKQQ
eukprot:TRINITY_DN4434_c0_g1_i1.p1 TRINITY_DN4434_c0_g1~~TRINITY_DN4434_c0_g1_i1.p1  ORF type:complete len:117 (-),score=29.20 TRINITY_DN4434_c0_g1_i1:110-460(-)